VASLAELVAGSAGFVWDDGNAGKNWVRHRVRDGETEQVFFNVPLRLQQDSRHSEGENRYVALGTTSSGRLLFVAFSFRDNLIRVISARDMNRHEVTVYAKTTAQESS
jgi:uncharacterized DUF497 family protein